MYLHLVVQLRPRLVRVDDKQLELAGVRVDVPRLEARAHVVQQVGLVEPQQLQVVHLGAALVSHRDTPPRHLGRLASTVAPTHDAAAAVVAERDHARRREGLGSQASRLELDPGDGRTVGRAHLNPHLDVDHHLLRFLERLHLDPLVHQHARLRIDTACSAHSAARLRGRQGAGARVRLSGCAGLGSQGSGARPKPQLRRIARDWPELARGNCIEPAVTPRATASMPAALAICS